MLGILIIAVWVTGWSRRAEGTNSELQSEFARTYMAKGREEGKLEANSADVIAVLEARGLRSPPTHGSASLGPRTWPSWTSGSGER